MEIFQIHTKNLKLQSNNMKLLARSIFIILVPFLFMKCDKANELLDDLTKDGPINYAGKVDSIQTQSGIYRVKVNIFPSVDVNRSHCILSWNITSGTKDSIRLDYTEENYDSELGCYYVIIDFTEDQIQGNLLIEAQNVDKLGNRSLITDIGVYIYGSIYISTLTNASVSFSSDYKEVILENKIGALGNYLSYELDDGTFTDEVFLTTNTYSIADAKYGGTVRVRTSYLLGSNSIDTLTMEEYTETQIPKERWIDFEKIEHLNVFNWQGENTNLNFETYGIDPVTGIQNDGNTYNTTNFAPATLFNGNTTTNAFYGFKFEKESGELVQSFFMTFDINHDIKLTRFKMYPRTANTYQYGNASVKRFRIWGTDDQNKTRYEEFPGNWTLIGEYVGPEPNDPNNLTEEEKDYFLNHNEFDIINDNVNSDANPEKIFRYMRIELIESYDPNAIFYVINEIELKGEIEKFH